MDDFKIINAYMGSGISKSIFSFDFINVILFQYWVVKTRNLKYFLKVESYNN